MSDDKLICTCNEVYESTIIAAIRQKNCTTVEAIGVETRAGTLCGECINDIESILDANR